MSLVPSNLFPVTVAVETENLVDSFVDDHHPDHGNPIETVDGAAINLKRNMQNKENRNTNKVPVIMPAATTRNYKKGGKGGNKNQQAAKNHFDSKCVLTDIINQITQFKFFLKEKKR